jgi:hypothetical protein
MVVLLTGLAVAYLSRTTSDRQVAHASFHQSRVDVLAQSAMDLIIGDFQQEIANGSTAVPEADGSTVYTPTSAANMVPQRRANAAGAANLIRVSVRSDTPVSPGVGSRASAVNSTTNASSNGRYVTSTRWNGHYLVPKGNTATPDSSPIQAFTNATPDWVFVAPDPNNPHADARKIITSPNQLVIGRYSYAIYDEGGLLDMNVAGYPTDPSAAPIPTQRLGRKGSVAFADLTALGSYPFFNPTSGGQHTYQIDMLVGWRNYATTNQSGTTNNNFPNVAPSSKAFARNFQSAGPTTSYYSYVVNNGSGFLAPTPTIAPNGLTDQVLLGRKQLIAYEQTAGTNANGNTVTSSLFDTNALQYLSAFSRETNAPSFSPTTPTAVNPNFLLARVTNVPSGYTRFDGTTPVVGEPLVKTRFPLSRLAWITYKGPSANLATSDPIYTALINAGVSTTTIAAGTAANVKTCFGLVWDSRTYVPATATTNSQGQQWVYVSPSSANTGGNFDPVANPSGNPASDIKTLATVASEGREPDFFELLRAGILDASLGQNTQGSNGVPGVTFSATADAQGANTIPDLHMSNKALHVLTIGACIIDQADPDSIPTRIQFRPSGASVWWTAYGVESLPYITQLYPITGTSPAGAHTNWATYLLFQLWNPHVGGPLPTPAPQVRLRVDGNIGIFTGGNAQTWGTATDRQTCALPAGGVSMALTTGAFPQTTVTPTPAPLSTPPVAATAPPVGSATAPAGFEILPPKLTNSATSIQQYVGLRLLPDYTLTSRASGNVPQLVLYFGTDPTHEFNATMEYTSDGTNWVPYNHFSGIIDHAPTPTPIPTVTPTPIPGSWINGATVPVHNSGSLSGTPNPSTTGTNNDQFSAARLSDSPIPDCLMKADPRATRFGVFQFKQTLSSSSARITDPLWPTGNTSYPSGYGGVIADSTGPVEHAPVRFSAFGGGNGVYLPATFCTNNAANPTPSPSPVTTYADADGVIRPADAAYTEAPATGSSTGSATPYYATTTAGSADYHPIVLNRPFRNVAELGYAFRDLPWKTLDFFTDKSADAGLLDIFTINDGSPLFDTSNPPNIIGMTVPTIVAGEVNLSSQEAPVLQSILSGAILDEVNTTTITGTGTSATSAPVIAANIVTETSTPTSTPSPTPCPLINRAELVTRPGLLNYILPVPASGAVHDQRVKSRREALVRAVSFVAQTRTWNLLIDVVAQSGHYKPNATSLQNDFVVEGEQHYWVHVAIDRLTGQVIDKQIEVVTE